MLRSSRNRGVVLGIWPEKGWRDPHHDSNRRQRRRIRRAESQRVRKDIAAALTSY